MFFEVLPIAMIFDNMSSNIDIPALSQPSPGQSVECVGFQIPDGGVEAMNTELGLGTQLMSKSQRPQQQLTVPPRLLIKFS